MKWRSVRLAMALRLGLETAACGYGVMRADRLFAAERIAVVPFVEDEPNGLGSAIAEQLGHRLASGGVRLPSVGQAPQATVAGTVHVGNAPSATLRGVQTYAVVAHVQAALRDAANGILWRQSFVLREEFLPTDPSQNIQPLVSEARRRTALVRLAERAAVAVHEAMVRDNFEQCPTEPL